MSSDIWLQPQWFAEVNCHARARRSEKELQKWFHQNFFTFQVFCHTCRNIDKSFAHRMRTASVFTSALHSSSPTHWGSSSGELNTCCWCNNFQQLSVSISMLLEPPSAVYCQIWLCFFSLSFHAITERRASEWKFSCTSARCGSTLLRTILFKSSRRLLVALSRSRIVYALEREMSC